MSMKIEDTASLNLKSEVLNIKIEVSNEGKIEEEVKETMKITEKIKKVIEESFGKDVEYAASKDFAKESSENLDTIVTSGENILVKMETTEAAPSLHLESDIIKLDYSHMSNDDYDDIADSESDHGSVELEELTYVAANVGDKSEEDKKEIDERLKLFAVEIKKVKSLPVPGTRKSDFQEDIKNSFEKLLPTHILDKLSPSRCGLCHEDFTSERYAWKHYTGFNHKRTVKYFINGTYKDHPSFYNMVLDAIFFFDPQPVTEKDIFAYIKKEHPVVGDNDERSMNLIKQRGLSRLLQIEYVVNKDGKFTATQALVNRKKRSKQLTDKTKPSQPSLYPEPVKLQEDTKTSPKFKEKKPSLLPNFDGQFQDQMFDFSKKDLPKSVIDTLTPENCGLCQLDIYCKPWSHYTGAGHRTTVELYQTGSYLGHPPYPTMVDKYIKEVQPATLDEKEVIKFLKKNFNVGEDIEKITARVEKCVEMLGKKEPSLVKMKNVTATKMKLPSDNLVWFKKDASKDLLKKIPPYEDERRHKDDKFKDDLRSKLPARGRDDYDKNFSETRSSNQVSKRRSPPRYQERDGGSTYDRSRKSDADYSYQSSTSASRSHKLGDRRPCPDLKYDRDIRGHGNRIEEKKPRSTDGHRRSIGNISRSPFNQTSHEKERSSRSDRHDKSPRIKDKSPFDRQGRSPTKKKRSSDSRHLSSRSSNMSRSVDHKRSRRDSRSQGEYHIKKESFHSPKSSKETAGRSSVKYSYSKEIQSSKRSSSTHQKKSVRHSSSAQSNRDENLPNPSLFRPSSGGDPLSSLTNPSPPPGTLPPDYLCAAPNSAIPTPVTQAQMPYPASFLTQHPQFPHVFILNTMGSQVGGQMMMPMSVGQQHPLPNQPPTL